MSKSLFLAILIASASIGTGAQASAREDAPTAPKKEKMICKSEKVTGSRTKVNRVCMTRKQWDQLAANTKKGLDEMGRSAPGIGICRYEDPDRQTPCF